MKALVVDDVAYSRLITQRVLEGLGFSVVQAASGAEALCVLSKEPDIDLVISDLMMPDMDGVELFEAAQELKRGKMGRFPISGLPGGINRPAGNREASQFFPFILLTASPRPEVLRRAKQGGFLDVLVKPLDPKRLAKTIDQRFSDKVDADSLLESLLSQLDSVIQGCIHRGDAERLSHIRTVLDERLKLIAARDRQGVATPCPPGSEATRSDAKAE